MERQILGVPEMTNQEIWVLLEEYNDYDQHGEYFVHAWIGKPTREQLMEHIQETCRSRKPDYIGFVLDGGGRIVHGNYYDNQWYILRKVS